MQTNNLDYLCAEYGQKIPIKEVEKTKNENMITKALGILQEDGVYAFVVYLASKGAFEARDPDEKVAESILSNIFEFLKKLELVSDNSEDKENVYKQFLSLTQDLDKLLFAKDLIEKILIYARFHAKALGE